MNRHRKVGAAIFTSFALTLALVAQTPQKLRVNTELVQIPVAVTNINGRYIGDLKKEHFRIWEDRIEQKILYFSTEEAPMSLVIVLDVSGSMGSQRYLADTTAGDCLKTGVVEDEYALIMFASRSDPPTEFTTDIRNLQGRLLGIKSQGMTALYDGIYNALATLKNATNPRQAIVIISDGDDNHSRYSGKDLRNLVREKNVQIFTFGNGTRDSALLDLTQTTGGADIRAEGLPMNGRTSLFSSICSSIVRELKNQYVISYKSTNTAKDGTWRKVRVELTVPEELQLHVRSKSGYQASPEN